MISEEESHGRLRLACGNVVLRAKKRKRQSLAMDVLKKGVFRRLSISPYQKHSAERRQIIEDRLCALVPQILEHTPNHPPYAEMIQRAIEKLEEEGGSTEASISTYIGSTYRDLPWAHSHLLPHHLRKLAAEGEIIAAPNSRYSLPLPNPIHSPEQHTLPHKGDNGDGTFPATPITTRPPKKSRKEPSQRPQRSKGGRRNRTKKPGSEQQETTEEVQVEIERKQPSLPSQPQRQPGRLPWNHADGQQTRLEEAVRTEHFDGQGSVVHRSEPSDVESGEKLMKVEASVMEKKETLQLRRRRSQRLQKQRKEVIDTENKGSVDHVDCDSLMIQAVEPRPAVMEEKEPSVNKDEETLPLLHSSSSPGESVNQPEEVRTIDATNNDSTCMVSWGEPTMAAVGETEASVTKDEEPLQVVLPQSSREQVKLAEARTTASDANDSLMVLYRGPIISETEDKEALASVGENREPFETQQQLLPSPCRDVELNYPEVGSFAADICNNGSIALSSGNAVVEKEASVTECRQLSQQRHSSALVDEQQKHPEVGIAASVEHVVKEKEKPKEQPPLERQLPLQCTDDDDVIVAFCWNPNSVKKEKEGKPNKHSGPTRRRSLRLLEQCQHGNEAQTECLTGALLDLPAVKREWEETSVMEEETSVMEEEGKKKKKQPLQQQQTLHRKAKRIRKETKELRTKAELSQLQQEKLKEQVKRQREDQKEIGTEMEPSQKKLRDKHLEEEPKEMEMEMELSQQQRKQLGKTGKEPQLQQKQQARKGQGKQVRAPNEPELEEGHREMEMEMKLLQKQEKQLDRSGNESELQQKQKAPKGQEKRGRPRKGPGLQQKQQAPKGQGKRGRPPKGPGLQPKQQAPKGQGKRGRPPKGPGLQLKQQAPKGQGKRGRPPKGPGLQLKQQAPKGQGKRGRPSNGQQKQQSPTGLEKVSMPPIVVGLQQKQRTPMVQGGNIMKESNQLGKETTPVSTSAAAAVGDDQSSKCQMAEIDQGPSVPQKKARGQSKPLKK